LDGTVVPQGTIIETPINPTPADSSTQENQKPPMPSNDGTENGGAGDDGATIDTRMTGDAFLNVKLPENATVFVNGRSTSTPGAQRQYVSRNLAYGVPFTYEVRAEIERDGKKLTQTMSVDLLAGQNKNIEFDFDASSELITSVSLNVPENATVLLGGVETKTRGPVRYYSTKELGQGQAWEDYEVEVSIVKNGKTVTQTKTVDIKAGQSVNLSFDFDKAPAASVASR